MGRYCTKEGKNDEKVKFLLQATSILKNIVCKTITKTRFARFVGLAGCKRSTVFRR